MDLASFLADELLRTAGGGVLVFAYTLPSVFCAYEGPITYIGAAVPLEIVKSANYTAKIRTSSSAMISTLERLERYHSGDLSLVYLDADHSARSIVRQINAAAKFSGPNTVFVMPGAVPSQRDMAYASPVPGQSSWVGEVWTLTELLANAGSFAMTLPVAPFGVLLASNVQPLHLERSVSAASDMQNAVGVGSIPHSHADPKDVVTWLEMVEEQRRKSSTVWMVIDQAAPEKFRTSTISPLLRWQRPPPSFVYNLSRRELDTDALQMPGRAIHAVQVDEFSDVTLPGRDIILTKMRDNTMCWHGKNTDIGAATNWMLHIGEEAYSQADVVTSLQNVKDKAYFDRDFIEDVTNIETPVFFATPDEYPNYGMWLLYSLPSVKIFKSWKNQYPKYLTAMTSPWQRNLLTGLGLNGDELLHHHLDRVYQVSSLATMRQSFRSLALAASDAEAFDEFAEQSIANGLKGPERIFISRLSKTRDGGHRGLRNEEALIDALRPFGIVAVEPERYSIAEQAGLFRNAELVVGLGGAGMFNVAFCRPGTKVVDIESGMGFVDTHCNLFASRGADYGIIIGSTDDDHPSPYQKTWTIDVDEVVRLLRKHF